MIPDLGKYAGAVLSSYAASILLICALVALSLWRSERVKRALKEIEERQGKTNG